MKWVILALLILAWVGLFYGLDRILKYLYRKTVERRIKDILYRNARYRIVKLKGRAILWIDGQKYEL